MTALVSRLFRKFFLTGLTSAVAGGLIIWLAANGLDPRQAVAWMLRIAFAPDNRPYSMPVVIALLAVLLYTIVRLATGLGRPPRATVATLRRALAELHVHALDVVPTPNLADASLARLRDALYDLQPYESLARRVRQLIEITDVYLLELTPGAALLPGKDPVDVASLHDQAREILEALMEHTSWAAEPEED